MSAWSHSSDDVLLADLADALCPPSVEATSEAVEAFVDAFVDALHRSMALRSSRARLLRRPRIRLAATALVGAMTAAVSTAATGASLPDPLRVLAVDVGLPVAPPAVAHLRGAMAVLTADLLPGSGADAARTAADAQTVIDDWRALDASWRAAERTAVQQLLADACQALVGRGPSAALPSACTAVAGPLPADGGRVTSGPDRPATASQSARGGGDASGSTTSATGDGSVTGEDGSTPTPASSPEPSTDTVDQTASTSPASNSDGTDTTTAPSPSTDDTSSSSLMPSDALLDDASSTTTTTTTTTPAITTDTSSSG